MITIFTLMNSFICFFLQKLNNFVGFITPVVKRWFIHMKRLVPAPAVLVLSMVAGMLQKYFFILYIFFLKNYVYLCLMKTNNFLK